MSEQAQFQTSGETATEAEAAATAADPRAQARGLAAKLRKPIDQFDPGEALEIVESADSDPVIRGLRRDLLREDAAVPHDGHEAGGPGVFRRVSNSVQKALSEGELLLDEERIAIEKIESNDRLSSVGQAEEIERAREAFAERRRKEIGAQRFDVAEQNLAEREKALRRAFEVKADAKPDPLAPLVEALTANNLLLASRPLDKGQAGFADLIATAAKTGNRATPALVEIASVAMRDPVTLHSVVSSLRASLGPLKRDVLLADSAKAKAAVELAEIAKLRTRVQGAKRAIEGVQDAASLEMLARRWSEK